MSVKCEPVPADDHNKLSLKLECSGEVQLIEEDLDCDTSYTDIQKSSVNSCKLVPPSTAPIYGTVAVTNSENVHFGDKYVKIYNGPVHIKQIVQARSGVNNESYIKTEDEDIKEHSKHDNSKDVANQKYTFQMWHKVSCSLVTAILIGCICAAVVLVLNKKVMNNDPYGSPDQYRDDNVISYSTMVEEFYYQHSTQILLVCALFLTLLVIYYYSLTSKVVRRCESFPDITTPTDDTINFKGSHADDLLIAPNHLRIVLRVDWLAQPPVDKIDMIIQPVPWVIVTHTATEACFNQSACVLAVRLMQTFHIESKGWSDIAYNFLVGGDGSAYYGRGWDQIGAHTKGYNKYAISIAFIGTFNQDVPPKHQVDACKKLIRLGVKEGKLAKDYKLFAHRQLMSTLSPGDRIYEIISKWPHFVTNYTLDLIPNY